MIKHNLQDCISRIHNIEEGYPERFIRIAKQLKLSFENGPWLAGGSIRRLFDNSKEESDFDLFFKNEEQLKAFQAQLTDAKVLYENEFNVTLQADVDDTLKDLFQIEKPFKLQLIKFYFEKPEDVLEWFDYTLCQFLTDGETLLVGEYTFFDVGRKHLVLNTVHHGVSTVRRMLKYGKQGYTICDGTIAGILNAVVQNPEVINSEVKYLD